MAKAAAKDVPDTLAGLEVTGHARTRHAALVGGPHLVTNGARVDFGDDEDKACLECRANTPPYPDSWVFSGGLWHAVIG